DGQGGLMWVDGNGGVRDFQAGNGTTFVSPSNDFGTLIKTGSGTFTYTDPQQIKRNFTTINGRIVLTSIVQPDGPSDAFAYDSAGKLTAVTMPGGWTATMTYNANNQLDQVAEPGGRTLAMSYDSSGDVSTVTMPDNSVRTFTYSTGHLVSDA